MPSLLIPLKKSIERMTAEKPPEGWPTQESLPTIRDLPQREIEDILNYPGSPIRATRSILPLIPLITSEKAITSLLGPIQKANPNLSGIGEQAVNFLAKKIPAKALDKLEGIVTVPTEMMEHLAFERPGKGPVGAYFDNLAEALRRLWQWYGPDSKKVFNSLKNQLPEGALENPLGKKVIFLREPSGSPYQYVETAAHEKTHLLQDLLGNSKDFQTSKLIREAAEAEAGQSASELIRMRATPTIDKLIEQYLKLSP